MIGCSFYKDMRVQQCDHYEGPFDKLLREERPQRVLEYGTGSGAFTLFIKNLSEKYKINNFEIKTFDILKQTEHKKIEDNGIKINRTNLFDHAYSKLEKPEVVENYIKSEGLTLVLCDGGHKKIEFKEFSKFLKKGDIIMAHDYVDTKENFEKNYSGKIWNWQEICFNDVKESCENHGLLPYMKEEFANIVWACFKKA